MFMCAQSLSRIWLFETPWIVAHQAPLPMEFGCHFLLQGVLLTQGSNLRHLHFLHWQADSLPLWRLGSLLFVCYIVI